MCQVTCCNCVLILHDAAWIKTVVSHSVIFPESYEDYEGQLSCHESKEDHESQQTNEDYEGQASYEDYQ